MLCFVNLVKINFYALLNTILCIKIYDLNWPGSVVFKCKTHTHIK